MKKTAAILLAILTLFSLAGCRADTQQPPDTPDASATDAASPAQQLLEEFREKASAELSAEDLARQLISSAAIPFAGEVMPVEPGFLNGFTEEISGFSQGAMFSPSIGAIPFIGYIFRLDDGADAESFALRLRETSDLRWNVCTQADEMLCEARGDTVFFVMAPASFED